MIIEEVGHIMEYLQNALFDLKKQVKKRYNFTINSVIYDMHVQNTFKNRRFNISLEKQSKIIIKVIANCYRRKKSIAKIAKKVDVS